MIWTEEATAKFKMMTEKSNTFEINVKIFFFSLVIV
jgi:hypothetical protein